MLNGRASSNGSFDFGVAAAQVRSPGDALGAASGVTTGASGRGFAQALRFGVGSENAPAKARDKVPYSASAVAR